MQNRNNLSASIVLTTYNGSHYIRELLESLVNQSRKIDEVLIYDDCSSDNTVEIVDEFINKYNLRNQWHLIVNKKNKGWKKNFKDAILEVKTDVVFPCDQDDVWFNQKVEKMMDYMEKNKKCLLLASDYKILHEDGVKNYERIKKQDSQEICNVKFDKHFAIGGIRPGCCMAIRMSFVKKITDHWLDWYPHDSFFWTEAVINDGCYLIQEDLITFRRHNNSASTKIRHTRRAHLDAMERTKNIISYYSDYDDARKKVFEEYLEFAQLRKKLLLERKLFNFFRLIKYHQYYRSVKQEVGDLYLAIFVKE